MQPHGFLDLVHEILLEVIGGVSFFDLKMFGIETARVQPEETLAFMEGDRRECRGGADF